MKASMFRERVRMPKTVLGEHSKQWWGWQEGGPQNPIGRHEQGKHMDISGITMATCSFCLVSSAKRLCFHDLQGNVTIF